MKFLIIVVAISISAQAQAALAATSVFYLSQFPDCSTALNKIGNTTSTLVIDSVCTAPSTIAIPPTLNLQFVGAGALSVGSASTVTIQGAINAGPYQIFSGSGTVSLSSAAANLVYPQWFGAQANCAGQVDDTKAIQNAVNAVGTTASATNRGKLLFPSGCYYTTNSISVTSGAYITIQGSGRFNTYLFNVAGSSGALFIDGGPPQNPVTGGISNQGGTTISDIALGSQAGPALYFYRSNNHVANRLFLFSAAATSYLLINGGSAGQYDDMLMDGGNTNSPPDPSGYFGTLVISNPISAIKIESIDPPNAVVTTEHSFNNIRTGAQYTGHAIDIVQSTFTWAMFGIVFNNAYVKSHRHQVNRR